jgi:uncharacterized RDD family membrane protein YckC
LSTLGQPHLEPSWKEEVNRRLAAHKSRKAGAEQPARPEPTAAMNSKAAEAAARVAARFAKAPTYSQIQAEEARVAVRAAQIATKVALEAQAVAETALAELHAAATRPSRGPAVVESIQRKHVVEEPVLPFAEEFDEPEFMAPDVALEFSPDPVVTVALTAPESFAVLAESEFAAAPAGAVEAELQVPEAMPQPTTPVVFDRESLSVRWDADLPSRTVELPVAAAAARPQEEFLLMAEDWWTPAQVHDTLRSEPLEVNTPPAHANLIEFPRELVATRKMRPRIADAHPVEGQLSIFEVDPGTVSVTPEVEPVAEPEAPAYVGPEWSGIQLGAHPEELSAPATAVQGNKPDVASLGRRLMTYVVDGSLILACFFGFAISALSHMAHVPAPRVAEIIVAAGLVLTGLIYNALFFSFGLSTPGMYYAGIALSNFDDELASAAQTRRRFGAMMLSLAPFGLGLVWAMFDDDHLSWHDRISGTYLRKKV